MAKELTIKELENIKELSKKARAAILTMTTLASSGHPGGSMSSIDFILTLYHMLNIDPKNPNMKTRDRVVFSFGHVSPAAYSTLGLMGFFDLEMAISQFRLAGSIFEGHVEPDVPGIEWASGNLGQGLSAGCGFALAARQNGYKNSVYVLMGDGEQQKGQIAEARRFAIKYSLNNLVAFVDYNKLQIGGDTSKIMPQNLKAEYMADGWDVIEIDGHDFDKIHSAIIRAERINNPVLILSHSVMGKGVSFMENNAKYHGSTIKEEELYKAYKEIGYSFDLEKLKKLRAEFVPANHTEKKSDNFDLPVSQPILYTEKTDNRSAWGNAIADIAKNLDDNYKKKIAVFDNDLQGSVKTNAFQNVLPDNYYEAGIMEHHTAVASGAMSKDDIQVFFPGFGVFGVDETYNQHRLNDINNTNLKVITTHVGLDVGEDGKTHQAIDYVGLMRNLYGFKIIVPADANQTDRVIRYISGKKGNYYVAMGRSKLDIIKDTNGNIYFDENYTYQYGKIDIVREGTDGVIFCMGTMTTKAVKVSDELKKEGISIAVYNTASPTQIDIQSVVKAAETGFIFTYEDHNVGTGLGATISNIIAENNISVKLHKFGVSKYGVSGKSSDVFKLMGLDENTIMDKIKKIIS